MSSEHVGLRLTAFEAKILRDGAALLKMGVSALAETAVLELAHRMGFYESLDFPMRQREFKDFPERREDETTVEKHNVSFPPSTFDLLQRVVGFVVPPKRFVTSTGEPMKVTIPLFIIGATMRYLANRKRQAKTRLQDHSFGGTEERVFLRKLAAFELMPQYE